MVEQSRSWIEEHAIAFALGELGEFDEQRFLDEAASDPDFEDLLQSNPDPGHLPAAMIARWHVARIELGELERSLIETHLSGCASCQEELELVESAGSAGGKVTTLPLWWSWIGGMAIGAAAMAAFLMLATREQLPSLQGERLEVVVPRALRGNDVPLVELPGDAPAFLLAVALPTDVEANSDAELELLGPDGRVLLGSAIGPAPWQPASVQLLVLADPRFEAGEYTARLRVTGEDSPRQLGHFRIELR